MSYLNGKMAEEMVVPVRCETMRGTAFFVSSTQLLTARHVVMAHFQSEATPIYISVVGRQLLCRGEELNLPGNNVDLALLTIVSEVNNVAEDYLQLLSDDFVPNLPLNVYGYPEEVAMGMNLVRLEVHNRLKIEGGVWNDRALVRDDSLHLHHYDGLSGSPVVSQSGRVVGVVVLQSNENLSYMSVAKVTSHLTHKGLSYDTDWTRDDITTLGAGRSYQQCKDAVVTIHDRYMPKLHQRNAELESILDYVTDKNQADKSRINAEALAWCISEQTGKIKEDFQKKLKTNQNLELELLIGNGFELLERCFDFIETYPFQHYSEWEKVMKMNELAHAMKTADFNRLRMMDTKNLCLIGRAGSGKTHSLCEYALKNQEKANIYLFFGTDFNSNETAIGHVKTVVCQDMPIEDYHQGLKEKGRYAVVVIDALNEGLGCSYWNNNLGALRSELDRYDHFRLIVSMRQPFDKEVSDLGERSHWHVHYIDGFVDVNEAIDTYFREYKVEPRYKQQRIEAFKNPLFLKLFCEAFHTLTADERRRVNKQMLYKRYVAKKNGKVSELTDEDMELNIADKYLAKLAHYSVFYGHFNPITRGKARQYAKRMIPYRMWSNDLLHACLTANLLLEDRSHRGESAVMFEYENLGDYYKAGELLASKMDVQGLLTWIYEEDKYLDRHPEEPSEKFRTAVKALFDCWQQKGVDVRGERLIQKGEPLYDLYCEYLMESDVQPQFIVETLLMLDHDEVNPMRLVQKFEEVSLDETLKIHEKLKDYPNVGSRDLIWTRYVNQMYEMYGDDYLGEVPIEANSALEVSDDERQYLICITWMLSSSHPKFRALIVRKLRKILNFHRELILWLIELFEGGNDPYVLGGMYCAICGVVLPSRDKEFVAEIAGRIYQCYYERSDNVPQDLIVRQWTLKIIERGYYLDKRCDYWKRIKPPFKAQETVKNAVPDYYKVKSQKGYFGLQQGSMMMHSSIFSFEDFNRYIIGTNSHNRSSDYFELAEDGKYRGVLLTDIMAEMSYYIVTEFGWNDKLGYLDNGKYSPDRSHNDQERIGKKFQWLAWYRVNARLMDACKTSKEQYFYRDEAMEEDFAETPYPWNTAEISRFDPTLDEAYKMAPESGLSGMEKLPILGKDDEGWITKDEYLPVFRCMARHEDGNEYVMLMGYDTVKDGEKETFMFSNAGFVRAEDADKFEAWAKIQNFYGRWMPERRGLIEFLWNDYPWADAYQSAIEHEPWTRTHDCPCDMMLSYETQLQEDWEGIGRKREYHSTVYMPCEEIMKQMGLYCSEVRGVIRRETDDVVMALNTGHGNCINGLFVRRDLLNEYLRKNNYAMFYYVLGEKVLRLGGSNAIMKDLSGAYRYMEDGDFDEVQKMRVIESKMPESAKKKSGNVEELDDYQRLIELSKQWDDESNDDE